MKIGRPAQQCTGGSLVKVGGTYVARAIRQYRTKPRNIGEGVETGWRAPHVGEGTVRLSSKGESDRITQRSAVQIRPPQPMNATAKTRWRSPALVYPNRAVAARSLQKATGDFLTIP